MEKKVLMNQYLLLMLDKPVSLLASVLCAISILFLRAQLMQVAIPKLTTSNQKELVITCLLIEKDLIPKCQQGIDHRAMPILQSRGELARHILRS